MPRFMVQRVLTGEYWAGDRHWCAHPIGARWFATSTDAELAALRDLSLPRPDWRLCELGDGHDVVGLDVALDRVNALIRRDFA